ncbi:MAG: D-tyrosyl-tRNA(Tyr) deacylase [Chloroflexi bacterium]|nr:D-tyrosyl-tRNA(Tyr) deacylase [Chloroflexota bacterium]
MRAVVQRVVQGGVAVEGETLGRIGPGMVILVGVREGDGEEDAAWLAGKVANLRIFADDAGRFDRSLLDVGGGALVISQFTLYGDARRGRRPSFTDAAVPEVAEPLVERFAALLRVEGVADVQTGRFGAHMVVEIVNDGPVTILLDTDVSRRGNVKR